MRAAARASRRKRSVTVRLVANSDARIFTATGVPMLTFSAEYTVAMPPRPISLVTLNFPSRISPTGAAKLVLAMSDEQSKRVTGKRTGENTDAGGGHPDVP